MNNEALNEFVKFMTETLKQGKDFALTQAPDILMQIIQWKLAESVLGVIKGAASLVAAYCGFLICKRLWGLDKETDIMLHSWGLPMFFIGMASFAACVFGIVNTLCNVENLIQIHFAPKVYLIEYFAHLVNK